MQAVEIIIKKRDGEELSAEEIAFFIEGFTRGSIPDYQAAAWAMAVLLQGMSGRETAALTAAMISSGDQLDVSGVVPFAVDKHSTGGVGDKTTLVVEPLVSACGVPVGKMSGRGLSFTGGTLDKMESIPGFRVDLSTEEFLQQLGEVGLVLSGQTADLAPADGKLYALRDVTGTVPSIPLIASSIMSKKLAAGAQGIVLDVKIGAGAFMHKIEEGRILANAMVDIARRAGRTAVALISDMNQPLGFAVGNAIEVREAIDTLQGAGPEDFRAHCLEVTGHMLMLAKRAPDLARAKQLAIEALDSGAALRKFKDLVVAQGGDVSVVEDPTQLPRAKYIEAVSSPSTGWVAGVHAMEVGLTALDLGAGRERKGEQVDHAVGVVVHKKVGDPLREGEALFSIHANHEDRLQPAIERVMAAYQLSTEHVEPLPLFYDVITS